MSYSFFPLVNVALTAMISEHKPEAILVGVCYAYKQPFHFKSVSVSGTCRILNKLLYTVRESAGFMGCIPVGRS